MYPAHPRVPNAALDGLPCQTVLAVVERQTGLPSAPFCVIVDARDVYAGWLTVPAFLGHVYPEAVLSRLRPFVPSNWEARLIDVPSEVAPLQVAPGQVIEVTTGRSRTYNEGAGAGDVQPANLDESASAADGDSEASDDLLMSDALVDENDATREQVHFLTGAFLVFAQDYLPEFVEVRLPVGVPLADALQAVAAARMPGYSARMPLLAAVHPQPRGSHALVVALPLWPLQGAQVIIDCRAVDGRIFAKHVAGQVTRSDLFRAAALPDSAETDVFVGVRPAPLTQHDLVNLLHGDLIFFVPNGANYHVITNLQDMLLSPEGWSSLFDPPGQLYVGPPNATWVMAEQSEFFHIVAPDRRHLVRIDLASRLGRLPGQLALQQAYLEHHDFCRIGTFAHAVLAVMQRSLLGRGQCVYFLDLRPILQGFSWHVGAAGDLDTMPLLGRFAQGCPFGYTVGVLLRDLTFEPFGRRLTVSDGQVLTVVYRRDALQDPPAGPGSWPPADGHDSQGPTGSSSDATFQAGVQASPGSLQSDAQADTGGTLHGAGYQTTYNAPCLLSKWAAGLFFDAELAGAQLPTSAVCGDCNQSSLWTLARIGAVMLCRVSLIVCLTLFGMLLAPAQAASLSFRCRRVPAALTLLLLLQCAKAAAVQLPAVDALRPTSSGTGLQLDACIVSVEPRQALPPDVPRRAIPTPVRSAIWHSNRPSPEHLDIGEVKTLLQHSAEQPDSTAMYLAATLLDTLMSRPLSTRPIARIKLDSLIPANPPIRGLRQHLEACSRLALWTEPLCIKDTPLGFSFEACNDLITVASLLRPWSSVGSLPAVVKAVADRSVHAFAFQLCPAAPPDQIWCFTDGSFTAGDTTGSNLLGWACVFLHPFSGTVQCAWGAVPKFLGCSTLGGSAYDAECCALLVGAILGLNVFSNDTVHYMSDCQSALAAAEGSCGFLSGTLAEAACNAHALRRALGSSDTHSYVPGHSNNLGNDVADALSKLGARGTETVGVSMPPTEVKMWFGRGATTLSWIGVALRSATGHPDSPPLNTADVGDDLFHAGLSPLQMIAPFVPPAALAAETATTSVETDTAHFELRVVTFNALSLISADDDPATVRTASRRTYTPGRAVILGRQLEAEGAHIAFIQEVQMPSRQVPDRQFS